MRRLARFPSQPDSTILASGNPGALHSPNQASFSKKSLNQISDVMGILNVNAI